jgi:SHS2 domain-containing protein
VTASHEFLEHTAEVQLRIHAENLASLLAQAGIALAELQLGSADLPAARGAWKDIEVHAADRSALLADWLNELIFRAETERWVPVAFDVTGADDQVVRARVGGVSVEEAPAMVKAATLHGIRVEAVPGGMEADVILDV